MQRRPPAGKLAREMAAWYYGTNGETNGPVEDDEIRAMLASGMIHAQTLVWRDGMDGWRSLREVPEWASQVVSAYPGAMPVAPNSGLAIASMVCGIGSLILMGSCLMGILAGIPAVICGHMALRQIRDAFPPIGGKGMAIAGLVTGYLSIGATVAVGVFFGIVFATGSSNLP